MKRIYLAGPEVFRLDALQEGMRLKALCRAHGLVGHFPLDASDFAGPAFIYQSCLAGIIACDAVVANISPFRGPHMDPGTAFEIGYAVAIRKPVFGWSTRTDELHRRIPHRQHSEDDLRIDEGRHIVEDMGLAENLMIAAGLASLHSSPEAAIAAAARAFLRR